MTNTKHTEICLDRVLNWLKSRPLMINTKHKNKPLPDAATLKEYPYTHWTLTKKSRDHMSTYLALSWNMSWLLLTSNNGSSGTSLCIHARCVDGTYSLDRIGNCVWIRIRTREGHLQRRRGTWTLLDDNSLKKAWIPSICDRGKIR